MSKKPMGGVALTSPAVISALLYIVVFSVDLSFNEKMELVYEPIRLVIYSISLLVLFRSHQKAFLTGVKLEAIERKVGNREFMFTVTYTWISFFSCSYLWCSYLDFGQNNFTFFSRVGVFALAVTYGGLNLEDEANDSGRPCDEK